MILKGPFQLRIFYDSMILAFFGVDIKSLLLTLMQVM